MYLGLTSLPIIVFERINVEKTGFNLVLGKVEPCRYYWEQHNTLRLSGIEPLHTVSQNPQQCRLKVHAFTIGSVTWGMFRPFMQFFFGIPQNLSNWELPAMQERTIKLETSLTAQ